MIRENRTQTSTGAFLMAELLSRQEGSGLILTTSFVTGNSTSLCSVDAHMLYIMYIWMLIGTGLNSNHGECLGPRYIPYALGGGYVLGRALVDFLATNSHQVCNCTSYYGPNFFV